MIAEREHSRELVNQIANKVIETYHLVTEVGSEELIRGILINPGMEENSSGVEQWSFAVKEFREGEIYRKAVSKEWFSLNDPTLHETVISIIERRNGLKEVSYRYKHVSDSGEEISSLILHKGEKNIDWDVVKKVKKDHDRPEREMSDRELEESLRKLESQIGSKRNEFVKVARNQRIISEILSEN